MMFRIRPLERGDLPEVVEGWNRVLVYDRVDEERFKRVVLEDPNYEKELNLVALDDGRVVGFIAAVAREGVWGRDGRGRPEEAYDGYIKGFYLLNGYWESGVGERLLGEVFERLRSRGKRVVKVVEYTGRYFFPGIDVRCRRLLGFFDRNGFERVDKLDDMAADLVDFEPSEYQRRAVARIREMGVEITTYRPEMIGMMREFVEKLDMIQWFPKGWERDFGREGRHIVAVKDGEIVGWACYWPGKPIAGFGPIGVLKEYRGRGIGTSLLLEAMLRLKEYGASKVVAGWAATGFYLKSGWKIYRQYIVFKKEI